MLTFVTFFSTDKPNFCQTDWLVRWIHLMYHGLDLSYSGHVYTQTTLHTKQEWALKNKVTTYFIANYVAF